jgi:hypothetical protein
MYICTRNIRGWIKTDCRSGTYVKENFNFGIKLCQYLKLFAADPSAPTAPDQLSVMESLMACVKGHTMATPN